MIHDKHVLSTGGNQRPSLTAPPHTPGSDTSREGHDLGKDPANRLSHLGSSFQPLTIRLKDRSVPAEDMRSCNRAAGWKGPDALSRVLAELGASVVRSYAPVSILRRGSSSSQGPNCPRRRYPLMQSSCSQESAGPSSRIPADLGECIKGRELPLNSLPRLPRRLLVIRREAVPGRNWTRSMLIARSSCIGRCSCSSCLQSEMTARMYQTSGTQIVTSIAFSRLASIVRPEASPPTFEAAHPRPRQRILAPRRCTDLCV